MFWKLFLMPKITLDSNQYFFFFLTTAVLLPYIMWNLKKEAGSALNITCFCSMIDSDFWLTQFSWSPEPGVGVYYAQRMIVWHYNGPIGKATRKEENTPSKRKRGNHRVMPQVVILCIHLNYHPQLRKDGCTQNRKNILHFGGKDFCSPASCLSLNCQSPPGKFNVEHWKHFLEVTASWHEKLCSVFF